MASEQDYTPEEQAEIAQLLQPFSNGEASESYFSPMAQRYRNDTSNLVTDNTPTPKEASSGQETDSEPENTLDPYSMDEREEMSKVMELKGREGLGELDTLGKTESPPEDLAPGIGDLGDLGTDAGSTPGDTGVLGELDALTKTESPPKDLTPGIGDLGDLGTDAGSTPGDTGVLGELDALTKTESPPEDLTPGIGDLGDLGTDAGSTSGDTGVLGELDALTKTESPPKDLTPGIGDLGNTGSKTGAVLAEDNLGEPGSLGENTKEGRTEGGGTSELFDLGDLITPEETPNLSETEDSPLPGSFPGTEAGLGASTGELDTGSLDTGDGDLAPPPPLRGSSFRSSSNGK